jgi:hypothetical protein
MKTNKKPYPIPTTYGIKDRIDTNPDFQRPAVWSTSQKQLLIDTILREYDIPKFYWRRTGYRPDKFDVVDGQQRLRAIWDFIDGKFKLPKDLDRIDDTPVAGSGYTDLPDDLRIRFDTYSLDVVVLEDTDDDEVREMFLRLQNGTSLKAQEKRNAYPGKMRDFVKELSSHSFFTKVGFSNSRYTYDLIIAQITCLELAGAPTNVKDSDLNKMYLENKNFDSNGQQARSIRKTLDTLNQIFTEKTPELERFNVISLYCVISELRKQYVISEIQNELAQWFIVFETIRRNEEKKPSDEVMPEWATYKEKISHSTDSEESIRWRMEFMLKSILNQFPTLQLKDNQREFTYLQRLAIFRRDNGHCQVEVICAGIKLTWDDWHCDHKTPWSFGGKTTVENGQVSCSACNLAKSNSIL